MAQHWSRVEMDKATNNLIRQIPLPEKVFEISGSKWKKFGFKNYQNSFYPEFDICEQVLLEKVDLIIAEQVWEHLRFPYKATKNVIESLNPKGKFLITVPFLVRYHPTPIDCYRWSASGLKYFLHECGFELLKIKVGSWGNKDCLLSNLDNWIDFQGQSLENDPKFPIHCWALASKGNF